jgi:hypothetical protein
MVSEDLTVSEIIRLLPQKLQQRFNSLGRYVQGIIEEEEDKLGRDIEISHEDVQLIQMAAFIYSLDNFLRVGTSAARIASITFEQFGFGGFQVGSTTFTRNNHATRRGELLAQALRGTVADTPLYGHIISASTMQVLISTLVREMADGAPLDR